MTVKKVTPEMVQDLCEVLASVDKPEDMKLLLDDLCTIKEVEQMAQRIKAARLLKENKTYTNIMENLDISSTTLSRVSRALQYGEGYNRFLSKYGENTPASIGGG